MNYAKHSTLLVLFILLIAACGDEAKEIDKERQMARSWASSVALIGDSWARRYTTTRFAEKALQRSKQTLEKESQSFESRAFKGQQAKIVLTSLKDISKLAGEMQKAVESGNRSALQRPIGQLRQKAEELKSPNEKNL
jgi:hypothetical protein